MPKGVIYVLTNPSFPEYVKIGYADDLQKRLKQLNRSECLPFAFRAYCTYEVEGRLKDQEVHTLIDRLNPDLRAIETFDGKPRVREFYAISPEDAYGILSSIAAISGTSDRLKKVDPVGHEIEDEQTAAEIQDTESGLYTEQYHLDNTTEHIRVLYTYFKDQIMKIEGMSMVPKKLYLSFRRNDVIIISTTLLASKIRAVINVPYGTLNDPQQIIRDMSNTGHWATGDCQVTAADKDSIDYIINLVKQACSKQNE